MAFFRGLNLLAALIVFTPLAVQAIPQKGEPAPPFKVTSTSGQQITLANYRGKVLLIEYFATWCSPCRNSAAHLTALSRKYSTRGVHVLGISMDDDGEKAVSEFIIANRLNYPVALAGEGMQDDYAVRSVPTLFVIGRNGLIAEKFMGYNDDIEKRLDQLLPKLLSD